MSTAPHPYRTADLSGGPYNYVMIERVAGSSYDYRAQAWREFHDHYHVGLNVGAGHGLPEKGYCGADIATCQQLPR